MFLESFRSLGNHRNIVSSTKLPELYQNIELKVQELRKKVEANVMVIRNLRKYQGKVKKKNYE